MKGGASLGLGGRLEKLLVLGEFGHTTYVDLLSIATLLSLLLTELLHHQEVHVLCGGLNFDVSLRNLTKCQNDQCRRCQWV